MITTASVPLGLPAPDDDADDRTLYLGNDHPGRALEIVTVPIDLETLLPVRVGRPSLSETGDSPQVRFRLPAATRAEAAALAQRERRTLSQLTRDALEAYVTSRRSA